MCDPPPSDLPAGGDHRGSDPRLDFPATGRNRGPILEVLRRIAPPSGTVLEIGSGSGQHAVFFARHLPALTWLPTDPEPLHRRSIAAWTAAEGLPNVLPPLDLDATRLPWPVPAVSMVYCANVIHIAPPEVSTALLDGASRVLAPGSPLVLYGPFKLGGSHTAPSNEAFDQDLRRRDPRFGVRDLDALVPLAAQFGLTFEERIPMPAQNQIVVFRKRSGLAG